jgi:hypothetical protein
MIVVLVEGDGDKRAVPILVGRESSDLKLRAVDMRGKSNIVRAHHGFEDTVRRQRALGGRAFLVLMDADVTFAPYRSLEEERADMRARAEALARELGALVGVCWSVLTAESWLIGGLRPQAAYCGLNGAQRAPANTETAPANPKAWLERYLQDHDYTPKTQECLARNVDLQLARGRNQSLRVFLEKVRRAGESAATA